MKHNLLIKPRESDYVLGANSPLLLKAVNNGDWTAHVCFNENQRNPIFDDDGCACYYANRQLDMWFDFLLPTLPQSIVSWLTTNNYLDTNSIDGKPHFHSSPWFTENLTGNGQNGNSFAECLDVIRNKGAIPYTAFTFGPTTTPQQYFVQPSAAQLALGLQFVKVMGGKNFLQYHFIADNSPKNIHQLASAIMQSPLGYGINVDGGWNQETPSDPPNAPPVHAVTGYKITTPNAFVADNYSPYFKVLDAGYPINYVMQTSVAPIIQTPTPLPLPTLPQNPSRPQILVWLDNVVTWLLSIQLKAETKLTFMQQIKSELLSLAANDYVKAFIVAVFTPVAALLGQALQAFGQGQAFVVDYHSLWHVAVAAGVGYLVKQFFTNSQGVFLGREVHADVLPPEAPKQ